MDVVGFVWDVLEHRWNQAVEELRSYTSEHKSALVPGKYVLPKTVFYLGKWVNHRRNEYRLGKLEQSRIKELEELGFVWTIKKSLNLAVYEINR